MCVRVLLWGSHLVLNVGPSTTPGVRQASSLTAVRYPDHEACAPLPAPVMSLVSAQDTSLPASFSSLTASAPRARCTPAGGQELSPSLNQRTWRGPRSQGFPAHPLRCCF